MKKSLLASATSGLLLATAFPPWQLDLIVWIALVPLLWSIRSCRTSTEAALCGWVSGFFFFSVDVRWVYDTLTVHGHFSPYLSVVILFLMTISLAFSTAVFGFLCRLACKSIAPGWVIFPTVWVSVEYARTYALTGFPWDLLGYSLAQRLNLVQVADITGVYGLSFVIVFINSVVLETFSKRNKSFYPLMTQIVLGIVLITFCSVYGWYQLGRHAEESPSENSSTIGILQGGIPQGVKWNEAYRSLTFNTYENFAEQSVSAGAELLIWPETSVPVVIGGEDLAWMRAMEISSKLKTPMLIGAPSQTDTRGEINFFNSAFLVNGSEILSGYDKIHLVPFGEYMPLGWLFPLGPGMAAREADFSPGANMTLMKPLDLPAFSVLICYEAIFPDLSRLAVNNGAQFLVNITNDGWFDSSSAPFQHLSMAKFRSIENRVWLIRSANTGISAAIDPAGRIVDSISLAESGWINVKIPEQVNVGSLYTKYGDVFALSCIIIMTLTLVSALIHKEKREGLQYDTIRH